MGFGTGHHASTRLCLAALQAPPRHIVRGARVLDLGTGSGVLAIAAAALGARAVRAVDRDDDALSNARDNVAENGVAAVVTTERCELRDLVGDPVELVTANLTGTFFARHTSSVLRHVEAGGRLIAGGITRTEERAVRAALEPTLTLVARATEDEWVGLTYRRPAPAGSESIGRR